MKPAPTAEEIAVARRWVPRFVEYLSGMGWEGAGCLMSLPAALDAAEARAVAAEKAGARLLLELGTANKALATAERERDEARAALKPFAEYAKTRDASPMLGLGDVIHAIHVKSGRAEITLTDCRAALAALREARA